MDAPASQAAAPASAMQPEMRPEIGPETSPETSPQISQEQLVDAAQGPAAAASPGQALGDSLELRDIHLPAEPGFWPPAPGWWLLALLVLAVLALVGHRGWRELRRRRRRQRILSELDQLHDAGLQGPALVAAVSALLKRVALSRYPRAEVAALTGDAWLAFLDRSGGEGRFAEGAGQVLAEGAYAPETRGIDEPALLAIARDWLRSNS